MFFFSVPQNPLCAKACKRDGTIKTSFCASEFGKFPNVHMCHKWPIQCCRLTEPLLSPVLTGKVTSLAPGPRGTLVVSISIIKTYKAGRLTITQVGETMSVKLVSQCKKCPLLRRGISVLDLHTHSLTPQISRISVHSSIQHWSNSLVIFALSDRHQLHHHGSSGWGRTRYPATWCIHSSIQSPTSQIINEYQQPTLLTSRLSRRGNSVDISNTQIQTLQCERQTY